MLNTPQKRLVEFFLFISIACPIFAEQNMIGQQSQNEGIFVLPVPESSTQNTSRRVVIDGRLDEWDQSGRILCFADQSLKQTYSAKAMAMWDQEALYYTVQWNDPTPMSNGVDPRFNPESGWKSDCLQLRFRTGDQTTWITAWYHAPSQSSVLHVAVWKDQKNWRDQTIRVLLAKPGQVDLGEGAQQAFRETDTGYIQEIRIPWKLLYRNPPTPAKDMQLQFGMEFIWGDPSGGSMPVHRYADNMLQGITSREFYWNNINAWGYATLTDQNHIPLRQYQGSTSRLHGNVPITYTLPATAQTISIAINDAQGNRVRNIGGLRIADYTLKKNGQTVDVSIPWDAMTDRHWSGNHREGYQGLRNLVASGDYTIKALYHSGIDATYVMSFYNPGMPVWDTASGTGAWGADHTNPHKVVRAGQNMIVAWELAEGGWGIIGLGADGKKIWSEKRGATTLAADEQYVYAVPKAFGNQPLSPAIIRLDAKTGEYRPFTHNGKELPFERLLTDLFDTTQLGDLQSIAVNDRFIVLAYSNNTLVLLNKNNAQYVRQFSVASPTDIVFNRQGKLYALLNTKLNAINLKTGKTTPLPTPGMMNPIGLTVDLQGNLLMADLGSDRQIKAYSPHGKLVYTCGKRGGRPIRGKYDPQGMLHMTSVAVDHVGHIWTTESSEYPRRVSIWSKTGKLVRDYMGNTGYAANSTYLHDTDPTLAYVGPLEFKIDPAKRTWKLQNILWCPDESKGESFKISTDRFATPQRFASSASGQTHEYLFTIPYYDQQGYVIYMQGDHGNWQPVSAITTVSQINGKLGRGNVVQVPPSGEWADCDLLDGVFWNDNNADGIVQRSECTLVKTKHPASNKHNARVDLPLGSGWGGRMDSKLRFYAKGMVRYEPIGFDDRGAPLFTPNSIKPMPVKEVGTMVPDANSNQVLVMSKWKYPSPSHIAGIDATTGKINWSYPNPFPGVHGSHRATMPEPGLIIGPLAITGTAHINNTVGTVMHLRGNLGQDYFMTTDGLFIDTLFADGRLPAPPLPETEKQLIGKSVKKYTQTGEAFNGFFGKQADGKIRLTTALAREACMILDVHGLESITRLPQKRLHLSATQLVKADQVNQQRVSTTHKQNEKVYTLKSSPLQIKIDADNQEWKHIPSLKMQRAGCSQSGTAHLAYDALNLYLFFNINDPTPWLNKGKDYSRLFKTGDAIDVQLSPSNNDKRNPVTGDLRIVIANLNGKPQAILMMPQTANSSAGENKLYTSPVMTHQVDKVILLRHVTLKVRRQAGRYQVEAAIPLASLGLTITPGNTLRGDFGFISSNATGTINTARTYWSNKQTNLVNDLPSEAWLYPSQWGTINISK